MAERVLEHRERGMPLQSQAVLFRASHHSAALEIELGRRNIPFVKYGGLHFLEAAHVKDVLAFLRWAREPARPRGGLPRRPARARHRTRRPPARLLDHLVEAGDGPRALAAFAPPAAAAEHWPSLCEAVAAGARRRGGLAGELDLVRALVRAASRAQLRRCRVREADLVQLAQIAAGYAEPRALPHRAHARPARRHQRARPARRTSTRII